ncbi:MAG: L,D-transpeptidase [Bacteroidales bacterium]|nr:L,D-transpeptidase [Bacteroidales bacterium]
MGNSELVNEESEPMNTKSPGKEDLNSINGNNHENLSGKRPFKKGILIRILTIFSIFIGSILLIAFLAYFVIFIAPRLQEVASVNKTVLTNNHDLKKEAGYKKEISIMRKDVQNLSRKYNSYTSGQSYIVINTTDNKFFLYKNKKLVREGLCSSGANKILQTKKKTYVFKTPKGKFSITGKRTHPYWHRSDWDFIEQGLPVPPKDDPSRWEEGTLGDYALDLVDGYMIHGTIYKRLMGMPVTHGCVRLGDEDLKIVYNTLNIGSKVYIF